MPSFTDCIVVPFGLSELVGTSRTLGVLAYADGLYPPAMSSTPVAEHTVFVAHSRNGKYVACLRRVLSEDQTPPSLSFSYDKYRVDVYDTDSWRLLHTLEPLPGLATFPNAMVVSNAGVVVIAANQDGIRVVDAVGKAELAMLSFPNGMPPVTYMGQSMLHVLEFSPAEDYLFVARISFGVATFKTADWTRETAVVLDARFYDPETPEDEVVMRSPSIWQKFSPSGDAVYLYGHEYGLRGKSWPALEPLTVPVLNMGESVTDLGFSADGQYLYFTMASDSSGVVTLNKLDLSDAQAQPVVVVQTEPGTFEESTKIGFSFSPDHTKVALMGNAANALKNEDYAGAQGAGALVIADTASGEVQKSFFWTIKGFMGDSFTRFAVWLPQAKLQLVTGLIKDADGAGVARDVLLMPRSKDSLAQPQWTQSDATGRFKVPVALKGELLSRVVFDSSGTFNDLIDKVQV